jgi:hypothetical protein
MNKTILVSLLVLAGVGLLLLLWPFIFRPPLFHNIVLAENVEIGSEWIEINPSSSLRVERDNNYIGLVLEPPFKTPYGSHGVETPDGKIVNPEISLADEDGNKYALVYSGAGGEEVSRYKYRGDLPRDKPFKKVLLRSDFPIKVKEILWSGYDNKDLK